jgi:hypothetical protein
LAQRTHLKPGPNKSVAQISMSLAYYFLSFIVFLCFLRLYSLFRKRAKLNALLKPTQ